MKNKPHELLKIGMIEGPSIVFCQYTETGKPQRRSHQYQNPKTCASIVGFGTNSLYLYWSGQEMLCSKKEYVKVRNPKGSGAVRGPL